MPNRQVFTPDLRACVERYRSVEHIPAMLIRGKVKEGRNPSLLGVGMRSGRCVTTVRNVAHILGKVEEDWEKRKVWELKHWRC